MNQLPDKDIIKQRLKKLEEANASNAIEGIHLPDEDVEFLKQLIRNGMTDGEMVAEIIKKFDLEPV